MFIQISDIVIMICFAVYLCTQVIVHQRLAVIMGIAGGVLPDALVALYELFHFKCLKKFHHIHKFFHNWLTSRIGDLSLMHGMIMESIVLSMVVFFVV